MAKKTLNKTNREALVALARRLVNETENTDAVDATYHIAADIVASLVEQKYPKSDMEILRKYKVGLLDTCVYISAGYGGMDQFRFRLNDERIPYTPDGYCNRHTPYLMNEDQAKAVEDYSKALKEYDASVKTRVNDFEALIYISRTFEDLVEIWPSAGRLRERICGTNTSIAAINDDVIKRIKSDAANSMNEVEPV